MYEKLGDLLNEALENNEIPQKNLKTNTETEDKTESNKTESEKTDTNKTESEKIAETKTDFQSNSENKENESPCRKSTGKKHNFTQKKAFPRGQVIKMHNYTENMHITPQIQKALSTLYLVYPVSWNAVKKQYHMLLKKAHPDTKNTIQTLETVEKTAQEQITELKSAFNVLELWYNKKR